jgi:urea transporter
MTNNGIYWIDTIFNWAVITLHKIGSLLGVTYQEINVWLFCIAWPALTLLLIYWVFYLLKQNRKLKKLDYTNNVGV